MTRNKLEREAEANRQTIAAYNRTAAQAQKPDAWVRGLVDKGFASDDPETGEQIIHIAPEATEERNRQ